MALFDQVDKDGLLEYSVVFNDRSLNSMSKSFQGVMRDLSVGLKSAYNAEASILVPGGGTFGMEAIARQFGTDAKCLVIRNGWFSFRWSEIFEKGRIAADTKVLYARQSQAEAGANTRQPLRHLPWQIFSSRLPTTHPMWSVLRTWKPLQGWSCLMTTLPVLPWLLIRLGLFLCWTVLLLARCMWIWQAWASMCF